MQKILIVDDRVAIRELVKATLCYDYSTIEAGEGEEAIQKLTENPDIELAILDIEMPGTNGWETLSVIRDPDNWPDLPVIMFTVRSEPESAVKAWAKGAQFYLTKPFSPTQLLETVQNALRPLKVGEDSPN